jgi:hypothetical protein
MFLWDWCLDLDEEQVEEICVGDTWITKDAP